MALKPIKFLKNKTILTHGCFALLCLTVFWTGYWGLDFGGHIDEAFQLDKVSRSIEKQVLLPRNYTYPSMIYDVTLLSLLPDIWQCVLTPCKQGLIYQEITYESQLRVRSVFLALSLCSMIWIYFLILVWRNSWNEAFLAAAMLGFSWEYIYHARYIAADALLAQFAILTLLCAIIAVKREKIIWLRTAAFIAGLGCSTKYPGGLLILPVLYAYWSFPKISYFYGTKEVLKLSFIFLAAYLVCTPGTVLEPYLFFQDLAASMAHYRGGHPNHTVSPGLDHALVLTGYLAVAVFSKYGAIALGFFGLMLIGGYSILKENRFIATIFLLLPVLYFVFFSSQKVMFVRNYIILIPFMAVLAARGGMFVTRLFPNKLYRKGIISLLIIALGVNLNWQIKAAESIHQRREIDHSQNIQLYLQQHSGTQFYLSEGVKKLITTADAIFPSNVSQRPETAEEYMFLVSGHYHLQWESTTPYYYQIVSGAYERNFDYYPDGPMYELKVISLPIEKAREMGIVKLIKVGQELM